MTNNIKSIKGNPSRTSAASITRRPQYPIRLMKINRRLSGIKRDKIGTAVVVNLTKFPTVQATIYAMLLPSTHAGPHSCDVKPADVPLDLWNSAKEVESIILANRSPGAITVPGVALLLTLLDIVKKPVSEEVVGRILLIYKWARGYSHSYRALHQKGPGAKVGISMSDWRTQMQNLSEDISEHAKRALLRIGGPEIQERIALAGSLARSGASKLDPYSDLEYEDQ